MEPGVHTVEVRLLLLTTNKDTGNKNRDGITSTDVTYVGTGMITGYMVPPVLTRFFYLPEKHEKYEKDQKQFETILEKRHQNYLNQLSNNQGDKGNSIEPESNQEKAKYDFSKLSSFLTLDSFPLSWLPIFRDHISNKWKEVIQFLNVSSISDYARIIKTPSTNITSSTVTTTSPLTTTANNDQFKAKLNDLQQQQQVQETGIETVNEVFKQRISGISQILQKEGNHRPNQGVLMHQKGVMIISPTPESIYSITEYHKQTQIPNSQVSIKMYFLYLVLASL